MDLCCLPQANCDGPLPLATGNQQIAVITLKACSLKEQDGRSPREQTARSLKEQLRGALAVAGRASSVVQQAPDLVVPVINVAMSLDKAYIVAQEDMARGTSAACCWAAGVPASSWRRR